MEKEQSGWNCEVHHSSQGRGDPSSSSCHFSAHVCCQVCTKYATGGLGTWYVPFCGTVGRAVGLTTVRAPARPAVHDKGISMLANAIPWHFPSRERERGGERENPAT